MSDIVKPDDLLFMRVKPSGTVLLTASPVSSIKVNRI